MSDRADNQTWVLLLRGINVNPATKVAMADLRALLEGLGYADVRTLLQSGNVVLRSAMRPVVVPIEAAISSETGVKSRVVALSAREFAGIASANPLLDDGTIPGRDDLSKMVITFLDGEIVPSELDRPSDADLAPERLVIMPRAIYQWCPLGILHSQLGPAWWRQLGPVVTSRNARTVGRILAALDLG
jgi:uncharacterized protein (DUF1697 family)